MGLALTAGLLLPQIDWKTNPIFWQRLMDFVHLPFFAIFAKFLDAANPFGLVLRRQRAITAITIAGVFAIGTELVQPLTGRQESWIDLRNGVFGVILAAFTLIRPPASASHWRTVAISTLAAIMCTIAIYPAGLEFQGIIWRSKHFPVLGDFEAPEEMRIWVDTGAGDSDVFRTFAEPSTEYPSHGQRSLLLKAHPVWLWATVRFLASDQNWTGYSTLAFDVFNPGLPTELSLRIDDAISQMRDDDRYHTSLIIEPGWNRCVIPLADVERSVTTRKFRLDKVRRVVFFIQKQKPPRQLYLDYVRLE